MRRVTVIGIGSGDPEDITIKAVHALNRADVVFLPAKDAGGAALLAARHEIRRRYLDRPDQRVVEIPDPPRDLTTPAYGAAVEDWYDRRTAAWETAFAEHLADDRTGALLAWGDPALYDGTLRVLHGVRERGVLDFEVEVVPGISAGQSLTARHGITLNQVGGSVLITTGRELRQGRADGITDVLVMLDTQCSFLETEDPETMIYWGAYLGTTEEVLIAGTVEECGETIRRVRSEARDAHGWMFDTYLLRRVRPD